jgi:hypothetical protein
LCVIHSVRYVVVNLLASFEVRKLAIRKSPGVDLVRSLAWSAYLAPSPFPKEGNSVRISDSQASSNSHTAREGALLSVSCCQGEWKPSPVGLLNMEGSYCSLLC